MGGTEKYLRPEIEVIKLNSDDIIITSCTPDTCTCDHQDNNEPDW